MQPRIEPLCGPLRRKCAISLLSDQELPELAWGFCHVGTRTFAALLAVRPSEGVVEFMDTCTERFYAGPLPAHSCDQHTSTLLQGAVAWRAICFMSLLANVAWSQVSTNEGCPALVSLGPWTALVANDDTLKERGNDIQSLVDCLKDGEALFLNTSGVFEPQTTIHLKKEVTVSGLDPTIERKLARRAADKRILPSGKTRAKLTCPGNRALFIMSNKAKITNLTIEGCKLQRDALDLDPSDSAKSANSRAPVIVQECKGRGSAGVSSLSFKQNTNREQAAAIFVAKGCTLAMHKVEVVSNVGLFSAVTILGNAAISQATFELNGFEGPNFSRTPNGGAILCLGGSVSMQASAFSGNKATSGGAVTGSSCDLNITTSVFKSNVASEFGGAVEAQGELPNVTITSSEFEGNLAGAGGAVAGLAGSRVRILESAFTKNEAGSGGAIVLLGCTATNSTAAASVDIIGQETEAMDTPCPPSRPAELENVKFVENLAAGEGGAATIGAYTLLHGRDLVFEGNKAAVGGALKVLGNRRANFDTAVFSGNSAEGTGGAVDMSGANAGFFNAQFVNNSAAGGGAVHGLAGSGPTQNLTFVQVDFQGNSAGEAAMGGALLFPQGGYAIHLHNSTFTSNSASTGGGIAVASTFQAPFDIALENVVAKGNSALGIGGGFLSGDFVRVEMVNCTMEENIGTIGGAVFVHGIDSVEMTNCAFLRNSASVVSGAISISQDHSKKDSPPGYVSLRGCIFEENSAAEIGAVSLANMKSVDMKECTFKGNSAADTNSALAYGVQVQKTSFTMADCKFIDNRLSPGGIGACAVLVYPEKYEAFDSVIETTTFRGNGLQYALALTAVPLSSKTSLDNADADKSKPGGARFFHQEVERTALKQASSAQKGEPPSYFLIRDVQFLNNTGGIQIASAETLPTKIVDCWFEGNTALVNDTPDESKSGGGIHVTNPALKVEDCTFVGNQVVGDGNGGAVGIESTRDGGEFSCDGCTFKNNSAVNGGAVALGLVGKASIRFSRSKFDSNSAIRGFGGALHSTNQLEDNVQFDCSSDKNARKKWIPVSQIFQQEACPGLTWRGNSAQLWGDHIGGPAEAVKVNTTFIASHRSQDILPPILVELIDGSGTKVQIDGLSTKPLIRLSVVNGTGSVNGQIFDRLNDNLELILFGVEVSAPVAGKPVNVTLQIDAQLTINSELLSKRGLAPSGVFKIKPGRIIVQVKGCRVGELSVGDKCRECQAGTFSTLTSQPFCASCPKGGMCQNGVLVPKDDFWMMDPWAHQVVKCRTEKACTSKAVLASHDMRREEILLEFHRANPFVNATYPSTNFALCSPGYEGVLCESCSQGYGRSGTECKKCGSVGSTIALVILTHSVPLILSGVLTIIILKKIDGGEGGWVEGGELLSLPVLLPIVTNYLQVMSTAQFIGAEWPFFLKRLFVVQGAVSSVGLDSLSNIECLMNRSRLHPSLQRVIIEALFPFMVVLSMAFLWQFVAFVRAMPWQKLKLCVMISTFNAMNLLYTSSNNAILSLFGCFDVFTTSELGAIADKFWAQDSAVKCYTGNHMAAVALVGVPGILLISLGVPVLTATFLWSNRQELFSNEHVQKFGFLYNAYRPKFFFWTGLITARKFLVLLVVVFTGSFGPQLQTQLFGFVLLVALLMQMIFKPFRAPKHNLLETTSLAMTWATLFIGMYIVGSEDRIVRVPSHGKDALALIVLIGNLAVLVWLLLELGRGGKELLVKKNITKRLRVFWAKFGWHGDH